MNNKLNTFQYLFTTTGIKFAKIVTIVIVHAAKVSHQQFPPVIDFRFIHGWDLIHILQLILQTEKIVGRQG